MELLETTKSTEDLIKTGNDNPNGLIGVLALGALAVVYVAINAISKSK